MKTKENEEGRRRRKPKAGKWKKTKRDGKRKEKKNQEPPTLKGQGSKCVMILNIYVSIIIFYLLL